MPRITIDRLIVCRESWSFAPLEIGFAALRDEAERFARVRHWARTHDMPRFVFVRTPGEVKPFYVDFCSPIFVNVLARMVQRSTAHAAPDAMVTVTEMLPAPDQAWLADADGRRYLSELRIVAVDLAGGG